jgi:hypothetical protein
MAHKEIMGLLLYLAQLLRQAVVVAVLLTITPMEIMVVLAVVQHTHLVELQLFMLVDKA